MARNAFNAQSAIKQPPAAARGLKGQSAIEYLTTYGWAILVLVAIVGTLFWVGIIRPGSPVSSSCLFPADISCKVFAINTTGHYALDIGQGTRHRIRITYMRCTQETNATFNATDQLPVPVYLDYGEHAFITNTTQKCYTYLNGATGIATGEAGGVYVGKMYIQYEEVDSGINHLMVGEVTGKYDETSMVPVTTPTP